MIPPRRQPPQEENVDSWLMSYADMITLLMCFFIIFVSVSEPKKDKFSLITDGIASKFGSVNMSTPLQGVYSALQGLVENKQLFRDMVVQKNEKSIEMELASASFFKPGGTELVEFRTPVLDDIVAALKDGTFYDYRIVIEGHSSDMPTDNGFYPTNWDLTSARAVRLVRYFAERGIKPERLSAVGYGETRPKVPNRDAQGNPIEENRLQNDRMVILFERE